MEDQQENKQHTLRNADHSKNMEGHDSTSSLTEVKTEADGRKRVEEWRSVVLKYWKPLVTTLQPLHVFVKAKFCDPDSKALQETLLDLHDRNVIASERLLQWLMNEGDRSTEDLLVRWNLFKNALEAVHPILHEIIIDQTHHEDTLEHQLNLLNFFMDDITRCVNPMALLPSLYSKNLLSRESCECLRTLCEQKGPTLGAIYMVCNIHRLRSDWYETFLTLLVNEGYEELVKDVDDKFYDTIMKNAATDHQTSSAKEETVLEAHGAAYAPSPVYAGFPPPEGADEPTAASSDGTKGEDCQLRTRDRTDETGLKSFLHSWRGTESDEEDKESFHSCDASFDEGDGDDLDLTLLKSNLTLNDPGRQRQLDNNEFGNCESMPERKELREKNILMPEERSTFKDNSNEDCEKPDGGQGEEEVQPEPLDLRPYQEELAREGLKGRNVIVVAPTGSGKTHVALRLIQNHLEQERAGVRKVVFLVNQVALAQQQYKACRKFLTDWRAKLVIGNAGAEATEKVPFKHLLMRADIVVMTAQVLLNALDQKEVEGVCQFSMLVLDECHHTNLQHPFNSIMHYYMAVKYSSSDDHGGVLSPELPQVLGLTASVGVGKAKNQEQARRHILKLCAHLDAEHICTVTENTEQLARYSNDPKYEQHLCGKRPNDHFQEKIEDIMKTIEMKMEKSEYLYHEDTEVLREKLKLRPHVRGTSQYTGWVSELFKTIAMLDDAEARRFMDSARCMLKFYNDSLVLNDECETQEALTFLHRQLNERYDPLGKRVTEMDRFLKELFDKNLPYLQVLSSQQLDTNPKLITLEKLITKAFRTEPESRAIVFVKTRDLVSALLKWMLRRPELKALKPGKMVGAGPSTDKGGMTKNQQVDVMEFFRIGDHKVMIATSVAEEGLDIRKCNLVIRYNHVTNEIAMVQARGRARATNSQFMTLASHDKGVQVKEEVNFIREMMMHEAIKELQSEIATNLRKFRMELDQIQKEEKSKRDAELAARHGKQLRQGEVIFRCRNCDAYAFVSSDVRMIESMHRVVTDLEYRNRNTEHVSPPQEFGQIQVRGRVCCRQCGEDWGPVLLFQKAKFPGIRLEGFRLIDDRGRKDIPKRWKQTNFFVSNLEPEELTRYRQDAIAVDYVDIGD
ncbi:ATP-dependent RNA helicase DHX58-like isoform X2 [Babylonia areolata]|uniref:ATP-dependent RNA helicase DHX58-like isoform X2 n=1 Tax=Babylonia areolata TaxID=304850 RepID=UPI003FD67049